MSASLFKPMYPMRLELPKMRDNLIDRTARVQKVRRALFGRVDHAETKLFVESVLAQHTRNECNRWEFDFTTEEPVHLNNNKGRFDWKAIVPRKITDAPTKCVRQEEFDNTECYHSLPDESQPESICDTAEKPVEVDEAPKRQSKITDFMQSRKRPADQAFASKKDIPHSSFVIPPKRAARSNS